MIKKIYILLIALFCLLACQATSSKIELGIKQLDVNEYFSDPKAIALANAAVDGNITKINELIDSGTPVDIQGRSGITHCGG